MGRVGEWATWEINREERKRSVEKEGQEGAGGRAGRGKLFPKYTTTTSSYAPLDSLSHFILTFII
jgi:hypothetical protein